MKKLLIIILLVIVAGFCAYKIIMSSVSLVYMHDRAVTYTLPVDLKQRINDETSWLDGMDPHYPTGPAFPDIALDYSLNLTAELLEFSKQNDINKGKANCIGYAQLCAAIYNYVCKLHNIDFYAKPVVGKVKLGPFDANDIAVELLPKNRRAFFKDHDFILVKENSSNQPAELYDPSAYDVVGDSFATNYRIK